MYSSAAPGRLADGFPFGCGVSQGCSDAQPRRPHTLLGFYLGGCATMSHLCLFLVLPGQGQLSHWTRAAWRAARAVWSLPLVRSPGEVWPAPAPRGPAGLQAASVRVRTRSRCSARPDGPLAEALGSAGPEGVRTQHSARRRLSLLLTSRSLSGQSQVTLLGLDGFQFTLQPLPSRIVIK